MGKLLYPIHAYLYALVNMMGNKVRTTLTIDKDILQTAMKMGINVSQFCENALGEAIQKLNTPTPATKGKTELLGEASFAKEGSVEPRAGFGPATPALPRRSPTRLGYRGTIAHASGGTVFYVLKIP
jgi:hypothetical protein